MNPLSRFASERGAKSGVASELPHCSREFFHIPRRNKQARLLIGAGYICHSRNSRDDHWQAYCHGLHGREWHAFPPCWEHKHIAGAQQPSELASVVYAPEASNLCFTLP